MEIKLFAISLAWSIVGVVPGARHSRGQRALSRQDAATKEWSHAMIANHPNASHIVCPVIAALVNGGDLELDENGNMEIADLSKALHEGLGIAKSHADFQAYGIVVYKDDQKGIETHRERCAPPTNCYTKRAILGWEASASSRRWLNAYTMNGKQATEHGISTGIRGGDTNMPPNALNCNGVYPCEKRFEQFFGGGGKNGRFYLDDMMRVVCLARQFGDRGGEHSYAQSSGPLPGGWTLALVPGREWQMKGAISSTLFAFSRKDEEGEEYLTIDDLRALFMEGRYPDNWQRREHGCLLTGCEWSALKRFNLDFECEVPYEAPFWQNTGCNVDTGKTCGTFSSCRDGEVCVSGKCLCGRDENLRTMCYNNNTGCQSQGDDGYSWFGSSRKITPAENDPAPGNPKL